MDAPTLRQYLIGEWSLMSCRMESPTHVIHPFGENAQGIIIYSPDGYMSAQIMMPGAQKYADNDLLGGTTEERAQAMRHYLAYSGKFEVKDTGEGKTSLFHEMQVCSFPGWLGDVQERLVSIEGDVLTLSTDPIPSKGDVYKPILQWKRIAPN